MISFNKLYPQSVPKHSVDQFKGIGMKIYFFSIFFGQNLLKNDISIHRICPQSGLKHSVVHFQGIGMKVLFF
jgi:hypothetical protein